MSSSFLSFPTQPSPSQPNPPLKPYRVYRVVAVGEGMVTNSSPGGNRDEPTVSGNTGPALVRLLWGRAASGSKNRNGAN